MGNIKETAASNLGMLQPWAAWRQKIGFLIARSLCFDCVWDHFAPFGFLGVARAVNWSAPAKTERAREAGFERPSGTGRARAADFERPGVVARASEANILDFLKLFQSFPKFERSRLERVKKTP